MRPSIAHYCLVLLVCCLASACHFGKPASKPLQLSEHFSPIGKAWSGNSVNATIFRKNSVTSSDDYQFAAYYDSTAHVVLARRKHGSDQWEVQQTRFTGNIADAHNVISIQVDGEGYLHISWDHHNNPLRYARSLAPESLEMGEAEAMTGKNEKVVSYPEFYRMADGGLLFAYRDGGSGNGNLVLNRYDVQTKTWSRLQTVLIDGEGQRNAYWQLTVDAAGTIHLSWVWRETPDVRSNHDLCYACSKDGGISWQRSDGRAYTLPITESTAEVVQAIPQGSNLINQTSMCADDTGRPYIATYYRAAEDSCTQFHVIYYNGEKWINSTATKRTLDFNLGGMGSRSIPISRPQLAVVHTKKLKQLVLIYRDEEVNNRMVLATSPLQEELNWQSQWVGPWPLDRWEPSYDTELLRTKNQLQVYFQRVAQGQGETSEALPAQTVGILELTPSN